MVTLSAIMVNIRGHYKNENNEDYCQVTVVDKIREDDHDTVGFTRAFHKEYTKIKIVFENDENILVMFKKYYYYIKVRLISRDRFIHDCNSGH